MGGAFGASGNTTPDDRMEHPLRPGRGEDRLPGLERGHRGRPDDPASRSASGLDVTEQARIGPTTSSASRAAPGARRTTRSRWPAARTRCAPALGREQPDRPLRRRCPALLLRVPRPVRRLLRRVHPRPAGRRGDARPRARQTRRRCPSTSRRRGEITTGHDRRRPAPPDRDGPPNVDVVTDADIPTFLDRLIERIGGWRRTVSAWHARRRRERTARPARCGSGGWRPDHELQLGSLRHEDDRPHPHRDRHQHRPRPDRRHPS